MSEYLNSAELHTVTGYARCTDQAKWLVTKGIPHMVDGKRIIVSREHVRAKLEGKSFVTSSGLNFGAIK